ncbi:NF-kappa-B inhibitor-interacting Ras-like protein 2 [Eurytemora carolleeae]|uniref:NF-kappa-B inhibitor-interacting Ras-like protein 2 n=1 Tax=Eurytemora carolleeae TaxID=1294199 RepID=UPI000C767D30|nr:NF-kappa-B inhibitor-interacting Ras-like protein 2 [Eurytemora carolleeae]|eukprot:XP_023339000.1 NF-kappa-B inhibitor-interacting Ras-like protein 2 [Eurytemora affinis]
MGKTQKPTSPTWEDVYEANVETDRGVKEGIRFFDTAGLDHIHKEIPRHLLVGADGFLIVYSVDDDYSYQVTQAIKKDIEKNREKKDVVILVLGNKKDKGATRQVDTTQV